jgi:hypothetical protein
MRPENLELVVLVGELLAREYRRAAGQHPSREPAAALRWPKSAFSLPMCRASATFTVSPRVFFGEQRHLHAAHLEARRAPYDVVLRRVESLGDGSLPPWA